VLISLNQIMAANQKHYTAVHNQLKRKKNPITIS